MDVSDETKKEAQTIALKLHRLIGDRDISRTDMIVRDKRIYVLEINALPGLTKESLVPKMAAAIGIDVIELARRFVAMAQRER